MRRVHKALLFGAASGALGCFAIVSDWGFALEEDVGLRWLFSIRGPISPPDNVVVISVNTKNDALNELASSSPQLQRCIGDNLDEKAIWPRCVHSSLIDGLARRGASLIVYDVSFTVASTPADDTALAGAMDRSNRVVLLERIEVEKNSAGMVEKLVSPIEPLSDKAAGLGPFPLPKVPARVNWFWTFKHAPTLPAVALQVYALRKLDPAAVAIEETRAGGTRLETPVDLRETIRALRRGDLSDPRWSRLILTGAEPAPGDTELVDALVELSRGEPRRYLNFYGPAGTIRTVSGHLFLNEGAEEQLDLIGKVAFVGASDLAMVEQADAYYTVFSDKTGVDLSGVEIAASAFANLLNRETIEQPSRLVSILVVLVFGVLTGFLAYLLPGVRGVGAAIVVAVVYFFGVLIAFTQHNLWLPLVLPELVQLPPVMLIGMTLHYLGAGRERENITRAMRHYVPESFVDTIVLGDEGAAARKELTGLCLFTDIEGFTTLAERLGPVRTATLLDQYHGVTIPIIERHGGLTMKFTGDGMMCLWRTENNNAGSHYHACMAALEIQGAVAELGRRHEGTTLPTRIGLHAGTFMLGPVGSGGTLRYEATGDVANTASRMQDLNKHLGTRVLATGAVSLDENRLFVRRIGTFQLKGKQEETPVFEILGRKRRPNDTDPLLKRYAKALEEFEAERWSAAAEILMAICREFTALDNELNGDSCKDGPTQFLLGKCRRHLATAPPPGQGCVVRMEEK